MGLDFCGDLIGCVVWEACLGGVLERSVYGIADRRSAAKGFGGTSGTVGRAQPFLFVEVPALTDKGFAVGLEKFDLTKGT